jgi:pyruvate kinase
MVARGDLGVEVPFEELPGMQKEIIETCRMLGKRVITATEMLESMIHNPRPTRAEISDVANAVFDGTSAIMLSGESAVGQYPELTVRTMAKIAEKAESNINYIKRFNRYEFKINNEVDALSHATCAMAIDLKAKAIVACTMSGITARMVSRFRCPVDILGMTTNEKTWRKLALSWGVIPVMAESFTSTDVLFYEAKRTAKQQLNLVKDDFVVITGGNPNGSTNLIKVEKI